MKIRDKHFFNFSAALAGLVCFLGLGFAAAPAASTQDAGQTAAPAAPAAAAPVVLPDGDGKPIATEFCQTCHKLTNLTKAHKDLDDWKDTISTMIERGAAIPPDKVDTLAEYLAKNFGPKDAAPAGSAPAAGPAAAPAAGAPAAAPATPAPQASSAATPAALAAASAAPVVLPDGDGKEIATQNCQACHKLTNLTKAHKDLDDWKDTVQLMIDRGANVPPDKVDTLVQYLAKNFGPKDASAPAGGAPASSAPAN